ncbi:hypothetical protein ml_108 [Mollivirus sibericum]|uniref:hypothetical protein n=1 Tax=Mollivirus sibericum TaxID=1678078 RepID=UPI0006B2DD96|nr:hypothetical protein ml_108 [Mollivirus sibericum]ALD61910.1 hypothetical protein ml_108 [Mollivirus sibericum]
MASITPTTSTARVSTKAGLNNPPGWIQDFHLRAVKDSRLRRAAEVTTFAVPRLVTLVHKAYPEESARLTLEILSARETYDDLSSVAASVIDAGLDVFDLDTLVSTCAPQPDEDEDATVTLLDPFDRSSKAVYGQLTVTPASWRFDDDLLLNAAEVTDGDDDAQVSSKQRVAWLSNWLKRQRDQHQQTQHDKESMRRYADECLARLALLEGDDEASRHTVLNSLFQFIGTAIVAGVEAKSGARISDALDLAERLLNAVMQSWTCRCASPCRCLMRCFWKPTVSMTSLIAGQGMSVLGLLVVNALQDRYVKAADHNNGHWPDDMTTARALAALQAIGCMVASSESAFRASAPHMVESLRDFYDITTAWILGESRPATDERPEPRAGDAGCGVPRIVSCALNSSSWATMIINCVGFLDETAKWLVASAQEASKCAAIERVTYSRSRLAGITWMILDGFLFAGDTVSEILVTIYALGHCAEMLPWTHGIKQRRAQNTLGQDMGLGRSSQMLLVAEVVYVVCVSAGPSSCLHPLALKCFARLLDAIYGGGRGDGLDLDMYLDLFAEIYADDPERLKAVARWAEVCIAQAHDCPGIVVRDSTCDKVKALIG